MIVGRYGQVASMLLNRLTQSEKQLISQTIANSTSSLSDGERSILIDAKAMEPPIPDHAMPKPGQRNDAMPRRKRRGRAPAATDESKESIYVSAFDVSLEIGVDRQPSFV